MFWGLLLGCGLVGRAQTFAEWWEQNSTRLKYYGEQIVALQEYIGKAEQGYQVVQSGLGTIRGGKADEFNLHQAFYASLGDINPAVEKIGEVAEIISLQAAIIKRFTTALSRYRQGQWLGADQVATVEQMFSKVLKAGLTDINSLVDILTANQLKFSDDQRLGRIEELDGAMRDRYAFTLAYTDQADLFAQQQAAAQADIGTVKGLYGVP